MKLQAARGVTILMAWLLRVSGVANAETAPHFPPADAPGKPPARAPQVDKSVPKGSAPQTILVTIHSVSIDPETRTPVLLLVDAQKKLYLPIFIGYGEAAAIARERAGLVPPRPMTHDLLLNAIQKLGGVVEKVTVTRIVKGTYYAEVTVKRGKERVVIDARPSDSIALAVRAKAPILVVKRVMDQAAQEAPQEKAPRKKMPEPEAVSRELSPDVI